MKIAAAVIGTMTALALVTASEAEVLNHDGYLTITSYDKNNVTLIVNMNNECVPGLGVWIYLPGSSSRAGTVEGQISWRVDTRPIRKIGYTATDNDDGQLADLGGMNTSLGKSVLNDMRRGNTLRIK